MTFQRLSQHGYTLVEVTVVSAVIAIVAVGMAYLLSTSVRYFHSISVRQQLQSDANRTMANIVQNLQHAQANTVNICSCGTTACSTGCNNSPTLYSYPPYSRIEYSPAGTTSATAIYWTTPSSVYMQTGNFSGPGNSFNPIGSPTIMVNNATGLLFTVLGADYTHLWVSLQLNAPSSPQQMETVLLSDQIVRLYQ